MMYSDDRISLNKLDDTNYDLWKIRMLSLLNRKRLKEYVINPPKISETLTKEEFELRNGDALSYIHQFIFLARL